MSDQTIVPTVVEREMDTFETPLKKQVVIKAYLTPIERRDIRHAYSSSVKTIIGEDGNSHFEVIEGRDVVSESEDTLVKIAVVSYDGSSENILDRLLNGPSQEHKFVVTKCNEIGKDPK
jgi:hypothetical protein